jgi:NitT/TauT family transport system permease protein
LLAGLLLLLYGLVGLAESWTGGYRPRVAIDLGGIALLRDSFFSLSRLFLAYGLSLGTALTYGYAAAKSRLAEPVLIALLDILQSLPVLSFMPGLVLALLHFFPRSNWGLELAAVLMIFTGHGWNLVFSFYTSLRGIPPELRDMTRLFRLRRRDVFRTVELPFAASGLLWNSMLSMAGGWFFLMVMESFRLGDQDFRLAGVGSYISAAYERHNRPAVAAGIGATILLIVLVDRCFWAPLVVWAERFKFDPDPRRAPRSRVLEWLRRSRVFLWACRLVAGDPLAPFGARRGVAGRAGERAARIGLRTLGAAGAIAGLSLAAFGLRSLVRMGTAVDAATWGRALRATGWTLARVIGAVGIGSLWAIPLGVLIGTRPAWTQRLQPVVQVVASFPAPMLFPLLTFVLLRLGMGVEVGAMVLMLFACQWYILFNVIAGASAIPAQLVDVAQVFRLRGISAWRAVLLPAVFPSLVNGWITAAGGAWNASIVAEVVPWGPGAHHANGIGAMITAAAEIADFPRLAGAIGVMVTIVVVLNRFFWRNLYRLAESRYRLETM